MKRDSGRRDGPGGKRGPDHRGRPRGGDGDEVRDTPQKAALRRKATQLVAQAGIPMPLAWQVAQGRATLNEVLQRMAREDRIGQLERRHELDRGTAAQVADGTQTLEDALRRKRLAEHQAEHRDRSVLVEAHAAGGAVTLHLHGLLRHTGTLTAVDRYEVDLQTAQGVERIHKLQIKLVHDAGIAPALGPAALHAATEPLPRPQDRFHCSDRRLFVWLDGRTPVVLRTLEGEELRGRLSWIARWEVGVDTDAGEVVVMRHALAAVEEA